ncbi:MAG: GIY-YIG nuclease family protein [Oligoflexus sp.]
MKQIYMITYPTGKIYIGKDSVGSYRYYGSPDMNVVNADFENLPDSVRKDYTIRKQILWERDDCSEEELAAKEVEFIRQYRSNDPSIGYNRWPKFKETA